jgi:hypothetical protein
MEDQNILSLMFQKGDQIKDKYKDFNFDQLDSTQKRYLNRLSFFSKHRERIIRKFNGTTISNDVKILFLD